MSIGAQAVARCLAWRMPPFSEDAAGLTRRYLTTAHRAALDCLSGWMAEAGMTVRLDAAGTLIGRYEAADPGAKTTLLIGSHIDSVRDAGAFDGTLGVMIGLGCVEALHKQGRRLPFAIEILAFGDEEGSRFHASMLGSGALAGHWNGKRPNRPPGDKGREFDSRAISLPLWASTRSHPRQRSNG